MPEDLLDVKHEPWNLGEYGRIWPNNIHSNAYEAARIVKPGQGKLYGFSVFNSSVSTQYILLFDRRDVPASGADGLVIAFPVATLSTLLVGYGDTGRAFDTGCVLANSSTPSAITPGSADCWFDAQYV